jgi:hypothetical protein
MAVQVKAPGEDGGWFWVGRNASGALTYSIYPAGALPDIELEACREAHPALEFQTVPLAREGKK